MPHADHGPAAGAKSAVDAGGLSAVGRAKADRGLVLQDRKPVEKARQIPLRQLMLPYTHHAPTFCPQQPVHLPISGLVANNLGQPEGGAILGPGGVLWTTVPDLSAVGRAEAEAAVHKYRGLALGLRVRQLFRSGDYYTSTGFIEGLVWCVDC